MNNPLVSVIIPVFNVEDFVKDAVQSMLDQTYKNLEIIVVDDGSDDNTYKIVEELSSVDSRIKLFRNKKNQNIANTLNRALNVSRGEYIARMDGDDISLANRIEKKVRFLQEKPEYDLVGCSLRVINVDSEEIGINRCYSDENLNRNALRYATPVSHIWVCRKKIYDRLKGYRDMPAAEDYDFLLRMSSQNMKFTNLQNYFGYSLRIGRSRNTISRTGVRSVKLHAYAYKLYQERENTGRDSFSEKELEKVLETHLLTEKLHSISVKFLNRAIELKHNNKYAISAIFVALSLISPYQVIYLYRRLMYRILIYWHTR